MAASPQQLIAGLSGEALLSQASASLGITVPPEIARSIISAFNAWRQSVMVTFAVRDRVKSAIPVKGPLRMVAYWTLRKLVKYQPQLVGMGVGMAPTPTPIAGGAFGGAGGTPGYYAAGATLQPAFQPQAQPAPLMEVFP